MRLISFVAAVLTFATPLQAATVEQIFNPSTRSLLSISLANGAPREGAPAVVTGNVTPFDETLGTLTGVEVFFSAVLWTQATLRGDVEPGTIFRSGNGAYGNSLGFLIGGLGVATPTVQSQEIACFPSFSNATRCPAVTAVARTVEETFSFDPAAWETQTLGSESFSISLTARGVLRDGESIFIQSILSNQSEVRVTYTFEPSVVPLPAAGVLLLASLGGMVLLRRRRSAAPG